MSMIKLELKGKFEGGQLIFTKGVSDQVSTSPEFAKWVMTSLRRHLAGDWGDMSDEDKKENDFSLDKHLRLFSSYLSPKEPEFNSHQYNIWIITEADRSVTTVLFPTEY